MEGNSGYREIEHTADWELEVWAPDLVGLLEQAVQGMYALSGVKLDGSVTVERVVDITAIDPESMLVSFLSELLYLAESESLGFDRFDLVIDGLSLHARLQGSPIVAQTKEIKAVTWHNLVIQHTRQGLVTRIVFDV